MKHTWNLPDYGEKGMQPHGQEVEQRRQRMSDRNRSRNFGNKSAVTLASYLLPTVLQ